MRKSIITSILFTLFLLTNNDIEAQQDPNFTLYNFNMNIINPAYAGIKESPEINMVYRNQFLGIDDSPRTISLAYSKPLENNLGIGISFINDRVFVLTQTDVMVDLSYKLKLNTATNLYFGMKAGGAFIDIDLKKVSIPATDNLFSQNQSFFNPHLGAGLHLQNENFYISVSTPNFLRGERYEKQGNIPSVAVESTHFYLGGGYHFDISRSVILTPRFMMRTVQGAPNSYDVGASLEYLQKFTAGSNVRIDETISFYALINVVKKLRFGFAYDFSTTEISNVNDDGSLELILNYQF